MIPNPNKLNIEQMWKLYIKIYKSPLKAVNLSDVIYILYPKYKFQVLSSDITTLLILGLGYNGMNYFKKFIEGITNVSTK